jgi:hypothetical protein
MSLTMIFNGYLCLYEIICDFGGERSHVKVVELSESLRELSERFERSFETNASEPIKSFSTSRKLQN